MLTALLLLLTAMAAAPLQAADEATGTSAPGQRGIVEFDRSLPIDLSAGRCEASEMEDRVTCSGSVRVVQGEAILTAETMTLFGVNDAEGLRRIEAEGEVRYANGPNAISGHSGIYDAVATELVVTGDVIVIQDGQVMTGGELIYNTETGDVLFTPGREGRVRGLFYTRSSDG